MKIEDSTAEIIEAHIYAAVGFVQGVYKHVVAPVIEDQPIAAYAIAGILGGIVVNKLLTYSK